MRVQRVLMPDGAESWTLLGVGGEPVPVVEAFLAHSDQHLPVPYETFRRAFGCWQTRIGLHDETGCATTVTVHRLRHTLGTRLINSGVPEHVIQRLLGHASPAMTAVYEHMHDKTIRAEFETLLPDPSRRRRPAPRLRPAGRDCER